MATILRIAAALLVAALACTGHETTTAWAWQRRASPSERRGASRAAQTRLNGVYRIDIASSDKLYSVVAGASSNLPFGEQQRFFIDLAVRLTPPDLIAIERRGPSVTIGSSRAPRVTFDADGVTRTERAGDGHIVRSRALVEGDKLTFTATGGTDDNFSVIFASVDDGRRLRVTRRISAEQLSEPVVIQTFYNKISGVAQWGIYGETESAPADLAASTPAAMEAPRVRRIETVSAGRESREADTLRTSLDDWIEATNQRDIRRQVTFYMPQVKAFYLARNVSRAFVRDEKVRVFSKADVIEVRAEAPELIFQDAGRTAVMRFRKSYAIGTGQRLRSGEVIQELRWQRTPTGWKIFSERDVRVIR